jgi:hypothetical protein
MTILTPTRKFPVHLSLNVECDSNDIAIMQEVLDSVSPFGKELHARRKENFYRGESVYSVDWESLSADKYSVLPDGKKEEVCKVNNIKWKQVFESVLDGERILPAVESCEEGGVGGYHLRFNKDEFSVNGNQIQLSLGDTSVFLYMDGPVEGSIEFDQVLVKNVPESVRGKGPIALNFVNREHPRYFCREQPTVGDSADAKILREQIDSESDKEVLYEMFYQKYPADTAIQLVLFLEGEIDTACFEYSMENNPAFGSALCDFVDAYVEHVPQKAEVILSRSPIDIDVSGELSEKRMLSSDEEKEIKEEAGFPVGSGRHEFQQVELLARKFSENAVSRKDVKNFGLCYWTPLASTDEQLLFDSIEMGERSRDVLSESFESRSDILVDSVVRSEQG